MNGKKYDILYTLQWADWTLTILTDHTDIDGIITEMDGAEMPLVEFLNFWLMLELDDRIEKIYSTYEEKTGIPDITETDAPILYGTHGEIKRNYYAVLDFPSQSELVQALLDEYNEQVKEYDQYVVEWEKAYKTWYDNYLKRKPMKPGDPDQTSIIKTLFWYDEKLTIRTNHTDIDGITAHYEGCTTLFIDFLNSYLLFEHETRIEAILTKYEEKLNIKDIASTGAPDIPDNHLHINRNYHAAVDYPNQTEMVNAILDEYRLHIETYDKYFTEWDKVYDAWYTA